MKTKEAEEDKFLERRRKAQERIRRSTQELRDKASPDLKTLIHELETRQVELEMQNEELRRARQEFEESQRQYADLYDFAPIGYFLLDRNGVIGSCNFMGAKLLGSDKHDILHLPFSTFVVKENWDLFSGHLRKVFDRQIRQIQELRLRTARLSMRHVQLQSAMVVNSTDPVSCRTAVIDITERKHAEEALRDTNENLQAQKEQLQSVNELLRVRQEELTEANEHLRTQELESARQARRAMTDQSAPHKANAGWHRQSLRL